MAANIRNKLPPIVRIEWDDSCSLAMSKVWNSKKDVLSHADCVSKIVSVGFLLSANKHRYIIAQSTDGPPDFKVAECFEIPKGCVCKLTRLK